jgi:GNAT superfamily N-acetyltransferase
VSDRLPVRIRPASPDDLESLVQTLGQARYFDNRLRRQEAGRGVLLTAWINTTPVGVVYLWLEPAEEPDIRTHLPGVPLLTHLEVVATHRRRAIGTKLITATEAEALWRGHDRIALAVAPDNRDAERLYQRRHYEPWGRDDVECLDDENRPELCRVLVKSLPVRRGKILTAFHNSKLGQHFLRMKRTRVLVFGDVPTPSPTVRTPRAKIRDTQSGVNQPVPSTGRLERGDHVDSPASVQICSPRHSDDFVDKLAPVVKEPSPEEGVGVLDPSPSIK